MYLEQEIYEQAQVIRRLLDEQSGAVGQVAAAVRRFDPTFICIAARGTSDNAARYAKYIMASLNGLPVMLAAPSLHTMYETPPRLARAVVMGISQSGQAEDVRRVLSDAREQGALTVAMTNYDDSPLAMAADHHLPLLAGEEVSIAATKTYTAELTLIAMLTAALRDDPQTRAELAALPSHVDATLASCADIAGWAQRYRYMDQFVVLGRGYNYCTAFEISLKVKELAYIISQAYSEADFRHGPIAMIRAGFPAMLVMPRGRMYAGMADLLQKLHERGAECLVISNDDAARGLATQFMPLPPALPEWLSPIVSVMPGQVFAMQQALVRGHTVDRPRGLTKVTVTR